MQKSQKSWTLTWTLTMGRLQNSLLKRQKQSSILAAMKSTRKLVAIADYMMRILLGLAKFRCKLVTYQDLLGRCPLWLGAKLLFTAGTLFVNKIGRLDLKEKTQELASKLDASIKGKIFRLPNETNIRPAHHDKSIEADTFIEAKLKDIKSLHNLQQIFGLQTSFFI
jgi:hypothetical protein